MAAMMRVFSRVICIPYKLVNSLPSSSWSSIFCVECIMSPILQLNIVS